MVPRIPSSRPLVPVARSQFDCREVGEACRLYTLSAGKISMGVGQLQTFNGGDVRLGLLLGQGVRLEPISHDQLSTRIQELCSVLEEKLFVWEMAHGFRDPHTIEPRNIWLRVEEVSHFLCIKLDEADRTVSQFEGVRTPVLLCTACLQR
jgi:hypothetical protein